MFTLRPEEGSAILPSLTKEKGFTIYICLKHFVLDITKAMLAIHMESELHLLFRHSLKASSAPYRKMNTKTAKDISQWWGTSLVCTRP